MGLDTRSPELAYANKPNIEHPGSAAQVTSDEISAAARLEDVRVGASVGVGVVGDNNALTFTAKNTKHEKNVRVALVDPGADGALSVAVVVTAEGADITVTLAYATGAVTSTAAQVKTAIEASAAANGLIAVAHTSTSTGAGICVANSLAVGTLAGGSSKEFRDAGTQADAAAGANTVASTFEIKRSN